MGLLSPMVWLNKIEHHFFRLSNGLEHPSISNETRTPYFWYQTKMQRTSNPVGPITKFTKLLIRQTPTLFFGIFERTKTSSALSNRTRFLFARL